jgi:hypothetical protein
MFDSLAQLGRMYGLVPSPVGPVVQSSWARGSPAVTHGPKAPDEDDELEDDELEDDELEDDVWPPLLLDEDDVTLPLLEELLLLSPLELDATPPSGMSSNETRSEQPAAASVTAAPRTS